MKFLVLQHAEHEGPGRYAELARQKKITLETVKLWKPGYEMPATGDYGDYDAALIMGGSNGVNDDISKYPSKGDEIHFIQKFPGPILGHCLGSQLIAHALGGRVEKGPAQECGFYGVTLTNEGVASRYFNGFPRNFRVFQWHGDGIYKLPNGAVRLATSLSYENQAFSCGNKIGLLYHWEMDMQMIDTLLEKDAAWFRSGKHGTTAGAIKAKAKKINSDIENYSSAFFDNFVGMAVQARH